MEKIKSILKGEKGADTDNQHSATADTRGVTSGTHGSSTSGTTGGSTSGSYDNTSSTSGAYDKSSSSDAYDTKSSSRGATSGTTSGLGKNVESFETREDRMAPAVTHETVNATHEDRQQQVVDKDRHQDHYHTTVQPLSDREVKPTVHKEQQAETQYREFDHEDAKKTQAALEAERAQYQNTRTVGETARTSTNLGTVESESVHHHLHETTQPVIEREVIQPSVTHTTIPIKEVHHEPSHIHQTSVNAPMSVAEFGKLSGSGTGSTSGTTSDSTYGSTSGTTGGTSSGYTERE